MPYIEGKGECKSDSFYLKFLKQKNAVRQGDFQSENTDWDLRYLFATHSDLMWRNLQTWIQNSNTQTVVWVFGSTDFHPPPPCIQRSIEGPAATVLMWNINLSVFCFSWACSVLASPYLSSLPKPLYLYFSELPLSSLA